MLRDMLAHLALKFRGLFARRRQEAALNEELAFHREQLYQQFRDEGLSPRDAELATAREFGAFADTYVEASRDTWRPAALTAGLRDLRFAVRSMARTPGFSVLAISTLALGLGACTTMFSVIQSTVRNALPVADQDRLMFFWEDNVELGIEQFSQSVPNFVDYRDQATSFEALIGTTGGNTSLAINGGSATHGQKVSVSAGFAAMFGWPMLTGREFTAAEDVPGGEAIAIISERIWRDRFGGRSDVLEREITIDRVPHRIIGVIDGAADLLGQTDVWLPLRPDPGRVARDDHWLTVIGKLKPAVSRAQAEAEIDLLAASLRANYPETMKGWDAHLEPLAEQVIPTEWSSGLNVLFAAVGLLLLIACANVANLLLSRSLAREREIAIRISLGATRGQIMRQLLAETLTLASVGTLLALLLADWSLSALRTFAPADLPRIDQLGLSLPSFGFAAIACGLATLLAGLLPALKGSHTALATGLGGAKSAGGNRSRSRLRNTLVVLQVALSLSLLVGAGMVWRSFERLRATDPGFDAQNVLTFQFTPDEVGYRRSADLLNLYQRMHAELAALPGVESVAQTSGLPFGEGRTSLNVFPVDPAAVAPEESVQASWRIIDANYFSVLRIPLVAGRAFTDADNHWDAPTIILSRRLADRFWPDGEAIGQRVNPGGGDNIYTVVGVAEDIRLRDLTGETEIPQMYFPLTLWTGWRSQAFALRTTVPPESLAESVRTVVRQIDPSQPVFAMNALSALAARDLRLPRLAAWLLGIFATIALLLATVGLYAVMNTSVAQRTREIGVRMALGARPASVLQLVLSQGTRLIGLGILLGGLMAAAVARVLSAGLYQTPAFDLTIYLGAATLLLLTALGALASPALRASRVDPAIALRGE